MLGRVAAFESRTVFRVSSVIPEPGTLLPVVYGALVRREANIIYYGETNGTSERRTEMRTPG